VLYELLPDFEVVALEVGWLCFGRGACDCAEGEFFVDGVLAAFGDLVREWTVELRCLR